MVAIGEPARITYTNYRGETAERTITPKRVWYGISDWHPVPQWFLTAFDHDKNADRDFALRDFGPANLRPGLEAAARWHEEEAERKRTVSVKSRRLGTQIATHQISAAALRALSPSPDHIADAGKLVEGEECKSKRERDLEKALENAADDFYLVHTRISDGQVERAKGTAFAGEKATLRALGRKP